jgi:hypothetical protein
MHIGRYFTYFPLPAHPNINKYISKYKSQTYVSFPHNAVCQAERRNSDIITHYLQKRRNILLSQAGEKMNQSVQHY